MNKMIISGRNLVKVLTPLAGIVGVSGLAGVIITVPVVVFALAGSYVLDHIPAAELITYWYSQVS